MHISQQHLVILPITRLIMIYFTVYQYILQYKTLEKIFDQKQKKLATLDKNRRLVYTFE